MFKQFCRSLGACAVMSMAAAPAAHAQWAVVDVGAIAQLIKEVATLRQQLLTAQAQLQQANTALATMTGNRGMQLLLSGIVRNYLPTSSVQLMSALQGLGAYPALATDVRSAMSGNAVMSPAQLSSLAPADQQMITADRQAVALHQALAQEALANSSARFAAIQSLIAAIPTASDQKGILELQARISAELGMLQNEQTKLQMLVQASAALDSANVQREREQAILAQGRFETRFQPVP
ncbi:MAG TPA: type IV secretion system protein [Steroidobacteraceae bacterium]|nr:type IV secretion system protein [Steroidobacteraceae bacterium]